MALPLTLVFLPQSKHQSKMERVFEDKMKMQEKLDDLLMDREDLSITISLLKTELTGRSVNWFPRQ